MIYQQHNYAAQLLILILALLLSTITPFVLVAPPAAPATSRTKVEFPFRRRSLTLSRRFYKKNDNDGTNNKDDSNQFDMDVLQERLMHLRVAVLEEELRQPPNPELSAKAFVREILLALWDNSNPLPDSGFRVLLRSSTRHWRHVLYDSVGAPHDAKEEVVASALGEAMSRPHNQFAILVNNNSNNNNDSWDALDNTDIDDSGNKDDAIHHHPHYVIEFPSEVVDYGDGTCWVEVRLRSRKNRSLFVVMGWELQQRSSDGAWLVDHLDWQDFRDEFRPGIGREEWMRICG